MGIGRWLFVCAALLGCSSEEPVEAIFVVPASLDELSGEHYLDHPLPSDLRLDPNGAPHFLGFNAPSGVSIVEEYLNATVGLLDGFSPAAPGYVRFAAPLDPQSLPQNPPESLAPDASVQLLDVDPASPERGKRQLIQLSFREAGGSYVLPNTLRWMPALGFPLRPRTQYALVVTRDAKSATQAPAQPSPALRQVLGLDPAAGPAATLAAAWKPAIDELARAGIAADHIAHLAVFTTGDPAAETIAVADHVRQHVPPPDFDYRYPWRKYSHGNYIEYLGSYGPSPNYQKGNLPFAKFGDGGAFNFVDGSPEVVDYFDLRFSLSVPSLASCPMPENGYPIVLHAHGTGGDYQSYVVSGYAATLADQCIASMGVDQIFHGTRPGAPATPNDVELLFFNFQNVEAARTNGRQSAIDEVQRARLFTETGAVVPAAFSHNGQDIRFDPERVMFFGHSQGGLNGPLYLAIDDSSRGGVLSGSGAVILITLLEKTKPEPSIAYLVRNVFLGLGPEEYEELDLFHPALMVAQTLVDAIDPINYARLTVREPRPGFAPKSILMTEGIAPDGTGDNYTPPRGTEAQAVAMGLPLMLPAQRALQQNPWGAPAPIPIPPEGLHGNLAGGAASGVLAQWLPVPESDGHFVVFDIPAARAQVAGFLRRLADDPVGGVPPP